MRLHQPCPVHSRTAGTAEGGVSARPKKQSACMSTSASTRYHNSHLCASPRQVFGFSVKRDALMYDRWDWSQLSTVAWNTDPALICRAHQHGAKVVANAELPANRSLLESTSFRASWVRLAFF